MKNLYKVSIGVIAGLLLFATGAYAANQGWLNFTGDEQVEQSNSNVDEIMDILRNVHKGKLDAEQALAELEALNPKGLVKKIKALEEEKAKLVKENTDLRASNNNLANTINELESTNGELLNTIAQLEEALANAPEDQADYVKHLEKELQRANQLVEQLKTETDKALEEAKTYE